MAVYIRFVYDVPEEEIWAAFAHAPKEVQEVVMNTAERLMQKGEERGIEKGRQEGIDIGEHRREVRFVARALLRGMEESEIADILELSIEHVRKLAEEAKKHASSD